MSVGTMVISPVSVVMLSVTVAMLGGAVAVSLLL